ncbi:unnamed protein product [Linum tenue]|uniref:Uncharacterized protein n=1 Tax=Linum tenue TaxID=586396 RepID=A0AAV0H5W8_9ROSI|nr:unnamed protein product [Linum tenue]
MHGLFVLFLGDFYWDSANFLLFPCGSLRIGFGRREKKQVGDSCSRRSSCRRREENLPPAQGRTLS